jgi:PPK2 family polyphosphate:nucleotide phosphotransferase
MCTPLILPPVRVGFRLGHTAAMTKALVTDLLRIAPGPVLLRSHDPRATPGFSGDKAAGKRALAELGEQISDLQERLYAEGRSGGVRSVLIVLQGMDTSGKGGVVRHCAGLLDPQGVQIASFKAPTAAEKARGFLWRVRQRVPGPGMIGIFDRSHYEDVLIGRVRKLAAPSTIANRYESINHFEADLVDDGTAVLKCFLHISAHEQRNRLMARLEDPAKQWKFNPADIDERARWNDYQSAYEIALERCNTEVAPWLVVPSDRKWYRNWAITRILLEHLTTLDPRWPPTDFDVAEQKARLAVT